MIGDTQVITSEVTTWVYSTHARILGRPYNQRDPIERLEPLISTVNHPNTIQNGTIVQERSSIFRRLRKGATLFERYIWHGLRELRCNSGD